jgi:ribosomal protein S18 acetylase RimI-like enzyme
LAKLEIEVEPIEVPTDHEAVIRSILATQPTSPADTVRRGLALFNLAHPGELFAPLHIFLRDPDTGVIHGGLLGRTGRGALHITELWVAEPFRRQRHGSRLIARAEEAAKARGCRFVYVETYTFHAPAFYERHGYKVFGCLAGFSGGHSCLFLRKDLEPVTTEGAA